MINQFRNNNYNYFSTKIHKIRKDIKCMFKFFYCTSIHLHGYLAIAEMIKRKTTCKKIRGIVIEHTIRKKLFASPREGQHLIEGVLQRLQRTNETRLDQRVHVGTL